MPLDRKRLAVIHIALEQVGLQDDLYRDILFANFGVKSSKELSAGQFVNLMGMFRYMGFESKGVYGEREGMASSRQLGFIFWLWKKWTGGQRLDGLNRWLAKYHGVSHTRFLTQEKAAKVITALEEMRRRQRENLESPEGKTESLDRPGRSRRGSKTGGSGG